MRACVVASSRAHAARPASNSPASSARDEAHWRTSMTPEQILAIEPRVLTRRQREDYFNDGFILLEKVVPDDWLDKLRSATSELVERSRSVSKSDAVYDLEPDHTREAPRLRRVSSPVDQHPAFWDYLSQSFLGDVVADLVGPGRQVSPVETQLQMGQGRRRSEVALRHPVLAAHQLFAAYGRDLSLRLRNGPGSGGIPARKSSLEDAEPVRRRRPLDWLPART